MNLEICKNCDKCCNFETIVVNDNNEPELTTRTTGGFYELIKCEKIDVNNKIFKKILNGTFYCDEYYENLDDFYLPTLFRNLIMQPNELCPYFAEHLMSDLVYLDRMKQWKNKQKKIVSFKKKLAKKQKDVILYDKETNSKKLS